MTSVKITKRGIDVKGTTQSGVRRVITVEGNHHPQEDKLIFQPMIGEWITLPNSIGDIEITELSMDSRIGLFDLVSRSFRSKEETRKYFSDLLS